MAELSPRARIARIEEATQPPARRDRIRTLLSLMMNDPSATRLAGRLARKMIELRVFPVPGQRTPEQLAAAERDVGYRELSERLRHRVAELARERGVEVDV